VVDLRKSVRKQLFSQITLIITDYSQINNKIANYSITNDNLSTTYDQRLMTKD